MFANINQEALQAASRKAIVLNSQWEELLSFRIGLQKSLDAANKLPSGDITALAEDIPDLDAAEQLRHDQQQALKQLQGMMGGLYGCLHIDEEPSHKKNKENVDSNSNKEIEKKRRAQLKMFDKLDDDEIWKKIEDVQKGLQPQWESILDQMNTRVQFGLGGQKSASNKALKVFHQSPWAQIESILTDDNRVVEKSRAIADESPRMGAAQELAPLLPLLNTVRKGDDDETDGEDEHDRVVRGRVGSMYVVQDSKGKRRLYDLEVFEDTGLYSLLLKAFISAKGSGEGGMGNMRGEDLAVLKQLRQKKSGKKVERKASKGRKIRYTAHVPLQHFTFPLPYIPGVGVNGDGEGRVVDRERLFASLFQ